MINWNEVTLGETEICMAGGHPRKVLGVFDDWVWLKDLLGNPCTYYRKDLIHWTIYDPWEEITEWCEFVRIAADGHYWKLYHNNHLIHNDNPNYKVKLPRVWKRKEG